jgi:hypothetical protein
MSTGTASAIPRDVAMRLCAEIREEYRGKWYTFNGLWCLGCVAASKGDPTKMCWYRPPDHQGCGQVNARLTRQQA